MKRSRRAQTVLGDRHDPVERICLQVQSAACGTRPAEFFNGWARTSIFVCAVGTMSCASLQAEQVCAVVLAHAQRARWISARSMFERQDMRPAALTKNIPWICSMYAANQSVFSVCVSIQVLQVQEARTRLVQEQLCMSRMHQQHLGFPILWLQARCCSNDQLQGRSRRPSWQHRTR